MTLPTKILLALVIVLAGSAFAYADVTAKEQEAVNFTPENTRAPASLEGGDQSQLTILDEKPNDQLEAMACAIDCHTVFSAPAKTTLAKFDLTKIK